jgi:hypothetical protein
MMLRACLFIALLFEWFGTTACTQTHSRKMPAVFVGSTPCDSLIKTLLQIPLGTPCDFIRWELTLNGDSNANSFRLHIIYGEAQPNTLGFKGGGQKGSFKGTYTVFRNNRDMPKGEIFRLETEKPANTISFLKLDENLVHLLTPSGKLMIGNGGWSYTLNRKEPVNTSPLLPSLTASSASLNDTLPQLIFDGRTPCQTFAAEHQMNVSPSCFKLKWRLVLNRDPVSHEPTTYTIRKVIDNVPRDVVGRWTIIRGIQSSPDAVIYQLDPDKPAESISLLVGDENVLFFINRNHTLYVGNSDFSFTLNKKQ